MEFENWLHLQQRLCFPSEVAPEHPNRQRGKGHRNEGVSSLCLQKLKFWKQIRKIRCEKKNAAAKWVKANKQNPLIHSFNIEFTSWHQTSRVHSPAGSRSGAMWGWWWDLHPGGGTSWREVWWKSCGASGCCPWAASLRLCFPVPPPAAPSFAPPPFWEGLQDAHLRPTNLSCLRSPICQRHKDSLFSRKDIYKAWKD